MNKHVLGLSSFALALFLIGGGCASTEGDTPSESAGDADSEVAAEALGECPAGTAVEALTTELSGFEEAGPFDLAAFTDAKANYKDGRLNVYISNKDFTVKDLKNSFVSPVKGAENGTGVLQFTMYGDGTNDAGPGEYDPTAGFGQPMLLNTQFRVPGGTTGDGKDLVFGFRQGNATVLGVSDATVCGTFDLSDTAKGQAAKGTFVATVGS